MKTKTITIGIPVYNEGKNIKNLISSLLNQKIDNLKLEKILIVSDGSTDETVNKIKKFKNNKIEIIDNPERMGIARGLNQITNLTMSDILVVLNGDISIKDKFFIQILVEPILENKVDLTSCRVVEKKTHGFFEKIISIGSKYRWSVYETYKNGNNVYTCRGVARGFSKRFYKSINFPQSVGEDMYSYFYSVKNGYKYCYIKNTYVYYNVPKNISDHKKQSIRYLSSLNSMEKIFGKKFITKNHPWPVSLFVVKGVEFFFKNPVAAVMYPVVYFSTKLIFMFEPKVSETWEVASTSK